MFIIILQTLDNLLGFPVGFDVVADGIDQYLQARAFVNSLKIF